MQIVASIVRLTFQFNSTIKIIVLQKKQILDSTGTLILNGNGHPSFSIMKSKKKASQVQIGRILQELKSSCISFFHIFVPRINRSEA